MFLCAWSEISFDNVYLFLTNFVYTYTALISVISGLFIIHFV